MENSLNKSGSLVVTEMTYDEYVSKTRKKLLDGLIELQSNTDGEMAHVEADELLLGYINDPEITEEFNKIKRFYA